MHHIKNEDLTLCRDFLERDPNDAVHTDPVPIEILRNVVLLVGIIIMRGNTHSCDGWLYCDLVNFVKSVLLLCILANFLFPKGHTQWTLQLNAGKSPSTHHQQAWSKTIKRKWNMPIIETQSFKLYIKLPNYDYNVLHLVVLCDGECWPMRIFFYVKWLFKSRFLLLVGCCCLF